MSQADDSIDRMRPDLRATLSRIRGAAAPVAARNAHPRLDRDGNEVMSREATEQRRQLLKAQHAALAAEAAAKTRKPPAATRTAVAAPAPSEAIQAPAAAYDDGDESIDWNADEEIAV